MPRHRQLLLLGLSLALAGCDNVGRAFDRNLDPNGPGNETGESAIQVVPVGGDVRDGRPLVRAVYPEGSGWPTIVPVVVEFSESVNEASLLPTSPNGIDGRIGVRVQGAPQLLPAQYDLLAGGKLLVIRPINGLPNQGVPIYEVVLFEDGRDVDGVRFDVDGAEEVLADFQVNQGEAIVDGAVLAVFPRDNADDHPRENDVFVVFDKPANAATLTPANLSVAEAGGALVDVSLETPLSTLGVLDPRVVRVTPDAPLASAQRYELTVAEGITFGTDGNLEFNGAVPFSVFDTVAPARPTLVELDAPQPGFPNKVNGANLETVTVAVTPPADAQPGDTVVARLYGGDGETTATFDTAFVERTGTVDDPAVPVLLDFSGTLGTAAAPKLDEGELIFVAQMRRGSGRSGFVHSSSSEPPTLDVTPPQLLSAGPPGDGANFLADGEGVAFYGVASEELAAAELSVVLPSTTKKQSMFASSGGGRFFMQPIDLERPGEADGYRRTYGITLTDASGNVSSAIAGEIVQRGALSGALAGQVKVRVFDDTTLLPVADATVLVDPATPSAPAAGQEVATTDADGVAIVTSALAAHTITVLKDGYDLVTVVDTQAADLSLPLTPSADPTATLAGALAFEPVVGLTAVVGSTGFADRSPMGVQTESATSSTIPPTPIVPNRAQLLTAFGGGFEPTTTPAYTISGCQICGPSFITPTVPPPPVGPGQTSQVALALIPVPPVVAPNPPTDPSLLAPQPVDFGLATGLDTANLADGSPRARVTATLLGFSTQALVGIGVVNSGGGAAYNVDATYSQSMLIGLAGYFPTTWLVSEAEDVDQRVARTRGLLVPAAQVVLAGAPAPMPIPSITAGTFSNPPAVTFEDVVDAATVIGGLGFSDLTITDASGRSWRVLLPDRDGATGPETVQLPDVSAAPTAGLAAGDWTAVAESRVFLSTNGATVDALVLTDRFRQEVVYSRSAPATLTVN